jgi:lipopolysaccharide exporter
MIKKSKIKSEFTRNVLTLMTGTTISLAIPIAISPILTRIYTPEDFGVFTLYMAITTIIAVIATGRYEMAIMLPKKDENAVHILILSLIISSVISLISFLIIFFFNSQIIKILGSQEISRWLYLVPCSILLVGFYNSFTYWINRKKKYKKMAQNKVIQSGSMATMQVSLGLFKNNTNGLIIGWFFGQLMAVILLARLVWREDKNKINKTSIFKMWSFAKRYKKFPLINSWSGLLNTASRQVPIILLTAFFSTVVTGLFSLAQRILLIPMTLLGNTISQVYFEKVSKLKDEKHKVKKITLEINKKLLLIGLLPISIIILWGDTLFAFVFGQSWKVAGEYAKLLSVWMYFVFITSPLTHLLIVYEKHFELVLFNTFLFLSRIGVLLIGWWMAKDALTVIAFYGILGAAAWGMLHFRLMKMVGVSYFNTFRQVFIYMLIIIFLFSWDSFIEF